MLIDIHTHHFSLNPNVRSIPAYYLIEQLDQHENGYPFTAGLHPWYLPSDWQEGVEFLEKCFQHPDFLTLGECGLDRLKGSSWHNQLFFFTQQLQWAQEKKLKAIVIHNVKSSNELEVALKKYSPIHFILHDYSCRPGLTQKLLPYPNVYFSLGRSLLRQGETITAGMRLVPINRLFFETDELELSISEIYELYSLRLKVPLAQLIPQIENNYINVFG